MAATIHISASGRTEGEARKQAKLLLLKERRAVYVRRGQRALLARLSTAKTATADDVRAGVELPPGVDARCLGAVPGLLARAGIIKAVGFVKSARPERHASILQVWSLVDRGTAARWLSAHPDYELVGDPTEGDNDLPLFDQANKKRPAAATVERQNC